MWEDADNSTVMSSSPALHKLCTLKCSHKGTIKIVKTGQGSKNDELLEGIDPSVLGGYLVLAGLGVYSEKWPKSGKISMNPVLGYNKKDIYREQFGFDEETEELLLKTQKGISSKNEQEYFAMLAGLCDNYRAKRWTITAGTLNLEKTKAYFKKLGLTDKEIEKLYYEINEQYKRVSNPKTSIIEKKRDFAHEMVALAIFTNPDIVGDVSLPSITLKGLLNSVMFGQIEAFSSYKGDIASTRFDIDDMQSDTDVNEELEKIVMSYNGGDEQMASKLTVSYIKQILGEGFNLDYIDRIQKYDQYTDEYQKALKEYENQKKEEFRKYLDFLDKELKK